MNRTLVLVTATLLAAFAAGAIDEPVSVDGGLVSGEYTANDRQVHIYRGIPYAAPPVGDLRWKPPRPVTAWEGVRRAVEFSPACPQTLRPQGAFYGRGPENQSEDCLYLNVWTPAASSGERWPVMVWIHGGALQNGTAAPYDGESLARKGVVLVTINYRLGPFGFLAHPLLSKESEHGSSGAYGLLDQIAALQWVRNNIAAFGGDPSRVTIFGESAGSWSVCFLMATPLARGLFHRAIGQSGAMFGDRMGHLRESWPGAEPGERLGVRFSNVLGCEQAQEPLKALRNKTPEEIIDAVYDPARSKRGQSRFTFTPSVDGWVFPDDVYDIFATGQHNKVPVIAGSNADEGSVFALSVAATDAATFIRQVREVASDLTDEFLALYPVNADSDVRQAYARSFRDQRHTWQMRTWARMVTKGGSAAYRYYFSRVPPGNRSEMFGAYHAAEIPYVFDSLRRGSRPYEEADSKLAEIMSSYWVEFAATGNPNREGLPEWPVYEPESDSYMEFGDAIEAGTRLHAKECAFYDKYYALQRAKQKQ